MPEAPPVMTAVLDESLGMGGKGRKLATDVCRLARIKDERVATHSFSRSCSSSFSARLGGEKDEE
jgi:hypothetical protein